jgi:hypothetical protein
VTGNTGGGNEKFKDSEMTTTCFVKTRIIGYNVGKNRG